MGRFTRIPGQYPMNDEIYVTLADLPLLKRAHDQAIEDQKKTFTMTLSNDKEAQFYTPYAGYLIEYLEGLKRHKSEKIRCNNCMSLLNENDLIRIQDSKGDFMYACPRCKTDEYLMDI